jgi:hypothetical protein
VFLASVDDDDLTILGILACVDVEDFLERLPGCFLFSLEDPFVLVQLSLGDGRHPFLLMNS